MQTISDTTLRHRNTLDTYLGKVKHLPPAPALMVQLIVLSRRHEVDLDEIVALLRKDPALSAEVLRRCNNSFIGEDRPARDIKEAVFCLGFFEIYQITLALYSLRMLNAAKEVPDFPLDRLREHSSITGIAAGTLAQETGALEGVAFTAGLLHDVGKLVLAMAEGRKYIAMMGECERTGESLSAQEKMAYGFSHTELGARLLERWGLPEEVFLPVLGHNAFEGSDEAQKYSTITNLASRLANYIGQNDTPVSFIELEGVRPLAQALGLDDGQIDEWEARVRNKIKQQAP